jgi:hypothetical protein
MAKTGDDTYAGLMSFAGFGKLNQRVYYYATAYDIASAHNRGTSGLYSLNLKDSLFYESFTTLDTAVRWSPGLWIDTSLFAPPSPPLAMKSQRANKYSPGQQSLLTMKAGFNLEPYHAVQLRFKGRRYLSAGDTCFVLASNDSGTTWVPLASYTGTVGSWTTYSLPLDSAAGFCGSPQARDILVRFYFKADAAPDTNFGWLIDDIKLKGAGPYYGVASQPVAVSLPSSLALSPAWPNPMSARATINLQLPVKQRVALAVFNVLGQRIRTLVDADLEAGTHAVTWDGADWRGRKVTNGVYFYQVRAGNVKQTQKVVIIR